MATIHATYHLRGYLSKRGYATLDNVLRQCAVLHNAGLQEWRDSYSVKVGLDVLRDVAGNEVKRQDGSIVLVERRAKRPNAKSPTYYDQLKAFTDVRADDPFWGNLDVNVGRGVLQRLERSKNAFFRRVRAGEKPGYPRFKSGRRWKTLEMAMVRSSMVKDGYISIKGLPRIKFKSGRHLPPSTDLKTLRITRVGRRVTVSLGYAVEREPLPASKVAVGIDMGITDRMVLSSGQVILVGEDIPAALESAEIPSAGVAPGAGESSQEALQEQTEGVAPGVWESSPGETSVPRRRIDRHGLAKKQRRLSRTRRGSRRFKQRTRIVANAHSRQRVSNRNQCHRITTAIVREYGHIGVEALAIKNMVRSAKGTVEEPGRNVSAKAGLNREIQTQTWGVIRQQLAYKAAWAGRRFVEVDPRHTSQMCSQCGVVDGSSREGKDFSCRTCGFSLDADVNAARNILRLSLAGGNSPPPSRETAEMCRV